MSFLYFFCAVSWARYALSDRMGFEAAGSVFEAGFGDDAKSVDGSSRSSNSSVSSPSELMTTSFPPLMMRWELASKVDESPVDAVLRTLSSRGDGLGT